MALITRVSRLFRADLHAVLDRVEEPDVLLKQAVREMEEDIFRDERLFKLLGHELGQLETRQQDLKQTLIQLDAELDICFTSNKEDLARGLIKRKLETERLGKFLTRKSEQTKAARAELGQRLEQNRGRLSAMQQKLELLDTDPHRTGDGLDWSTPDFSVRDDDIEVALLREKQMRTPS